MLTILIALSLTGDLSSTEKLPTELELRNAIEQWRRQVVFTGKYRLKSGFSRSKDEALRGETDPSLNRKLHGAHGIFGKPGRAYEANGTLSKKDHSILHAFDSGKAGILYMPGDFTLEPVIEATNGELAARYFPRRYELLGESAKNVRVFKTPASQPSWTAGIMTSNQPTPLHPWRGGEDSMPFSGLAVASITRLDENHIEARCAGTRREGIDPVGNPITASVERRVVFLTTDQVPVIVRVEEIVDRQRPGVADGVFDRDEYVSIAEDFVKCPGGPVARLVRFVAMQHDDVIRVVEWRSDDLGQRAPTPADFAINVPEDVPVRGLTSGYEVGKPRSLRLDDIDASLLADEPKPVTPAFQLVNEEGLHHLLFSWLVGVFLFMMIAWWYRRSTPRPASIRAIAR